MALIIIVKRLHERRPSNDYDVTVKVTETESVLRTIDTGQVFGHRYEDGWPTLLAKFLQQNHPEVLRRMETE